MSQAELIETIVQEVMKRLKAEASSCKCGGAAPSPRVLNWPKRLVTWKDLESQIEGVQVLRVPPRAVITPEARDWLRRRGVRLEVAGQPPEQGK